MPSTRRTQEEQWAADHQISLVQFRYYCCLLSCLHNKLPAFPSPQTPQHTLLLVSYIRIICTRYKVYNSRICMISFISFYTHMNKRHEISGPVRRRYFIVAKKSALSSVFRFFNVIWVPGVFTRYVCCGCRTQYDGMALHCLLSLLHYEQRT